MAKNLGRIVLINRDDIQPFIGQPREYFPQDYLQGLAKSIKNSGQKEPIHVIILPPSKKGKKFELIDGQCRWHACGIAGIKTMRAIIDEVKDKDEQFMDSFLLNLHRRQHTELEIAKGLKRMLGMGKTIFQISDEAGYSQSYIAQHLSILKLPQGVIDLMKPTIAEEKRIKYSTALLLVTVPSEKFQLQLAETISKSGLSHSQAKQVIERTMRREGLEKSGKDQQYRKFAKLSTFVSSSSRKIKIALDYPKGYLRDMLRGRPLKKKTDMVEQARIAAEKFNKFGDMIESILRESLPD